VDARDLTPEALDNLVLRWRAMSARRQAPPGRCNCGCKCATDTTAISPTVRIGARLAAALVTEPVGMPVS
jgi:hypothetical protein